MSESDVNDSAVPEELPETRRLLRIMERLRGDDGCPWDAEQTLESLKSYLIEECGEVLEAIEMGDYDELEDELGDLLLQVVFQCQICAEQGHFDFESVAVRIADKMVRRHPHVFSDTDVEDSDDVRANWDEIKKQEREDRGKPEPESILDGIPRHLPALMRAKDLQKKASKVGFDWEDEEGILDKIEEELSEMHEALRSGDDAELKDEIGDVMFAITNLARHRKIDPEDALNGCNRKFKRRFRSIERALEERGKTPSESTLMEMDALWDESKKDE